MKKSFVDIIVEDLRRQIINSEIVLKCSLPKDPGLVSFELISRARSITLDSVLVELSPSLTAEQVINAFYLSGAGKWFGRFTSYRVYVNETMGAFVFPFPKDQYVLERLESGELVKLINTGSNGFEFGSKPEAQKAVIDFKKGNYETAFFHFEIKSVD